MANAAIAAVNRLFWAPTPQRRRGKSAAQRSSCQKEVTNYIIQCMLAYPGPPTTGADIDKDQDSYHGQGGAGTVAPLQADLDAKIGLLATERCPSAAVTVSHGH